VLEDPDRADRVERAVHHVPVVLVADLDPVGEPALGDQRGNTDVRSDDPARNSAVIRYPKPRRVSGSTNKVVLATTNLAAGLGYLPGPYDPPAFLPAGPPEPRRPRSPALDPILRP
jgi:hypothetical protein